MKRMNYSSITAAIRRIHQAKSQSDASGVPIKELMDQDRELRKKLQLEREEKRQRREFLKAAGGLGLGAGMLSVNPSTFAGNHNSSQPSIAIVGAGAGGLRTAHRLQQYGFDSTIYEASGRVGGRMYSDSTFFSDNRVVEYGGEFISSEHHAVRNLAHKLGLQLEDANKLSVGDEETYLINNQLYSENDLLDQWVDGGIYQTMKQALKDAPWQPLYNSDHTQAHLDYDALEAGMWMGSGYLDLEDWVQKLLLTDLVAEYGITNYNSALNLIYLLGYNTRMSGGLPLAGTDERYHVVGGNDLIPQGMAEELTSGSIEFDKKLVSITGTDAAGPYTLHFDDLSSTTCDVLVMSLPINLVKDIEFSPAILSGFSTKKQEAFDKTWSTPGTMAPYSTMEEIGINISDNGKLILEFSERFWDRTQMIHGNEVHQAARAYSNPDGFISTWEGEPGNPSSLGVLVDYNGGYEARNLASSNLHGEAHPDDVVRFLDQAALAWPGVDVYSLYTGKALVSNWIDDPLAGSAFISPGVDTMTVWWGAQWEIEENMNMYFAGEAYHEESWSYMEGAIASAEAVAKAIHQRY